MKGATRAAARDMPSPPRTDRILWRGSLRVMLLMFSAMSVQKWLLRISAALIVIGYLLPLVVERFLVSMGLALPLVPLLFAGGLLLRYFIAPRTMRLIPHVREQVLGGIVLTVAAIATAVMLASWTFGLPPDRLWIMWLWVAAPTSVLLLIQFVLVTSLPGSIVWFVTISAIAQSLQSATVRAFVGTIAQNEWSLAGIIVGSWSALAFWLLRVRAFKSPTEIAPCGNRALKVSASHAAAIRAFLFGNPSFRYQFAGGFVATLIVGAVWTMVAVTQQTLHSATDAMAKFTGPALGVGAFAGIGGFLVARRSKSLWLRGGVDRAGAFRICETQAWSFFGATVLSVLVLVAIVCAANPEIARSYLVLFLFHLCAGVCLMYLGLMHVRGWRVLDALCAIALSIAWLATFPTVTLLMKRPWLIPIVIAAMAGVTIAFRLIALHRWRRIDWLVCRPPKLSPRGLPAAR